jgi:hypothetical protein
VAGSYVEVVELGRSGEGPQKVGAIVEHTAEGGERQYQGATGTQYCDVVACITGQQHRGAHVRREAHNTTRSGAWCRVMTWNRHLLEWLE